MPSPSSNNKDLILEPGGLTEQILHYSFQNSHLLVLSINTQGEITFCNKGLLKSLKKEQAQLLGKDIFDIFEFDLEEDSNLFSERSGRSFEARVIRQSWPTLLIRFDTILQKSGGEYYGLTLVGENITEKVSVEKALQKSNAQLKEIFDNSNDLIQVFNAAGVLTFVNEAWKSRLGYSDQEIKKLRLKDVIHPEVLRETGKKLREIENGILPERFETILSSKYGKKIYVTGTVNCTLRGNLPTEFRAVFFDISERIRAERAQSLYYKIANLTIRSSNLDSLYSNVLSVLQEVLDVSNFTVALKNNGELEFPYRIRNNEKLSGTHEDDTINMLLAEYTFERNKPLIIYDDGIQKIAETKNIKLNNEIPKIWMGVLIQFEKTVIGVISIHSTEEQQTFNFKDLELLDFISSQVSLAIERKWNEAKIKSQSARIKAIFESSSHQIWSLNKDLEFTSFNQNYANALVQYYGITPELGLRMDKLSSKSFKSQVKSIWINKFNRVFKGETINFQNSIIDLEGNKIWRDVFLSPIFLPDGTIEEISAIANDITEKKRSDVALQESEEKFRNIFESFQDIYFRCDLKGMIVMVSPSVIEVLGQSPKALLNRPITEFFKSEAYDQNLIRRLYKDEKIRNFDATALSEDGKEIKFLCNIRLVYQGKKAVGIEGVARDITQLMNTNNELMVAKELAERSLRIKERFLANMSHEIRTPMNGIIGMIDLVASTRLNKEQLEYVKTIKKSSETLLNILNDILDLSKIEAGKMELRKEPVNLAKSIEKLYDLYSQEAHRNSTSLYYHIDEKIPTWAMLDETRLLQVLSNLTSNAIKFSDAKGNINISLRLKESKRNKYVFRGEIKDAGIGIAKENLQRLFNTFSQIDNSQKKTYAGTGLGLAISKELVKSMNGEIGVVSTPGFGSTFWFTFEADKVKDQDFAQETILDDTSIDRHFIEHKPVILLVDDNLVNRKVASQILMKAGCIVDLVDSGRKAIEKVKKKKYDLILMDIQMPGMDGIETTEEIRKLNIPNLPPVVAMTAYSMEEDRSRFLKQGLDDYLAKPIKAISLIEKVKDWISFEAIAVQTEILEDESKDLIINQNTLNQLFKYGGEDLIKSVLEEFDEETDNFISECKEMYKSSNFDGIRSHLHTIKGNAGTFGIERLGKCAELVEKKLKEKNYINVDKDLRKVERFFGEFKKNYKSIINS